MNEQVNKEITNLFLQLNLAPPILTQSYDDTLSLEIINVTTQDKDLFYINNKELLIAVNLILKKLLEKQSYKESFILDFDGEQLKFINETKQKAEIACSRVLEYDKPYEFGYLSSFERMIIHSYLKQRDDVDTHSHGVGKDRRLVISKKKSDV